ncbi:MAG: hypothetical protein PUE32_09045 [Clostridia bacterium]|nr:hypothetical protein [Clostridia bacterium]
MKELSIFVDESGDFGEYDYHAPFYIISMVLHDQSVDIDNELNALENELTNIGWKKNQLSKSELFFFSDKRTLKKNYLKPLSKKEL